MTTVDDIFNELLERTNGDVHRALMLACYEIVYLGQSVSHGYVRAN